MLVVSNKEQPEPPCDSLKDIPAGDYHVPGAIWAILVREPRAVEMSPGVGA